MAPSDFQFTLRVADETRFDRMLTDVSASILRHVGYAADTADGLVRLVHGVIEQGLGGGARQCEVRFRTGDGELEIAIASDAARPVSDAAVRALPSAAFVDRIVCALEDGRQTCRLSRRLP